MDYVVLAAVLLMSLTSLPMAFVFNRWEFLRDSRLSLLAGLLAFVAAGAVPAFVLRRRFRNVDFVIYVFAMFCWSTVIGLSMALEFDGYVRGSFGGYFVSDEPYLNTSHGIAISYWDGSGHFLLQLSGVALYCMQESYREVGLYWSGSMINTLLVFLVGAILGPTGVKLTYFFNLPITLMPLVCAFNFLRDRPLQARSYRTVPSIFRRPMDLMFLLFFVLAFGCAVFRGLAVLGGSLPLMKTYLSKYEPYLLDPSSFPKAQVLVYLFYFSLYYLCAMEGLLNPGQLWMADWAIIHAGASAQSQFSHMIAAIHPRTGLKFRAPKGGVDGAVFWAINLALLVVPHLFAWRCWRDPDNCGRTYTTALAQPSNVPASRHSYRTPKKGQ